MFFFLQLRIKFKWSLLLFTALVGLMLLFGCSVTEDQQYGYQAQEQSAEQGGVESERRRAGDEEEAVRAKEIAYTVDGVIDVAAVSIDQQISLAADVRQMKRFQLKSIRRAIFHKLRAEFPHYEIHVTTDRKLLRDLKQLEQAPYPYGKKEKDRLAKINEDMKG